MERTSPILASRLGRSLPCVLTAWIGWMVTAAGSSAQIPAFPGALGFGANASGGRHGDVYHVTTLADSGTGSFRDAVSQPNRIVVFDVGGYITLSGEVSVRSDITIAGQTAPGGGIGISGAEVSFGGRDNIICRFVRIRPGSSSARTANGINMYRAENIILDHISVAFAKWNDLSGVSDDWQNHPVTDITIQHSIIANPIGQQFGVHAESVAGDWFWYGNLFANSHNRNPLAKCNTVFINNVNYNYQGAYTTHTSTSFKHDIVNNYFIGGPGSGGSDNTWYQIDRNQSIYYAGNRKDRNLDGVLNGSTTTPYWYQGVGTVLTAPWSTVTTDLPIHSAATAFARTLSLAGALPRDEMDALLISQVRTLGDGPVGTGAGTTGPNGSLYTSQSQTGLDNTGFGTIPGGTAPADSDQDGMADFFEQDTGSDPHMANHTEPVPAGAFVPDTPAGYTRLDEYLHFLASPHLVIPMNETAEVDLLDYSSGYYVPRVAYKVENSTSVTATVGSDGTVLVAPPSNFVGRAQFDFRVGDASGADIMTQTIFVVVSGALTLPPAPTGLTATAISSREIALEWHDLSPNEEGFRIERSTDGTVFTGVGSVGIDVTNFTDSAGPGASVVYRVRAYNLTGYSGYSNPDTASTEAGPPGAPTTIQATPANSRVNVSWSLSPGATSYRLKRSLTSGGGYTTIARPTESAFDDIYAVNGTTYDYVVSAVNGYGESPDSEHATATPSAAITYPAEDETYGSGAVFENSNAGFNGTGYVNFSPDVGSYLQFDNVDGGSGGPVTLRFRNALGNLARTGRLIVNGVESTITFESTSTWATWMTRDVEVTLDPGARNTIRLESTGADLANIDELTVFGTAVAPPPPSPLVDRAGREGDDLILSGFAGAPLGSYRVLSSTNLYAPAEAWPPVATNLLDGNGVFHVTNALNPLVVQLFFRVDTP